MQLNSLHGCMHGKGFDKNVYINTVFDLRLNDLFLQISGSHYKCRHACVYHACD